MGGAASAGAVGAGAVVAAHYDGFCLSNSLTWFRCLTSVEIRDRELGNVKRLLEN